MPYYYREREAHGLALHLSELLFALLPFAVVFLIAAYENKDWVYYVMAPEWAFASALLFGQTIVKIVQGALRADDIPIDEVALVIAVLIVLCLVPSMVLLALILTAPHPPLWMGIAQVILALVAATCFVAFGVSVNRDPAG